MSTKIWVWWQSWNYKEWITIFVDFIDVYPPANIIKSKTITNDQELIPYPALKTKREITKYINWQQLTKGMRGKPNEQLFPRQVVIQLPKYVNHIIGEPKYKYGQQEQVTVRNHNRSTALERSVLKYWGGGLKPVLRVPNLALSFCHGSKHIVSYSVRVKVF